MNAENFGTIAGLIQFRRAEQPDRTFLRMEQGDLTFAGLDGLANQLAGALHHLGLGKGDVVASMLPTSHESLAVWFGASKAGIVQASINIDYRGELLANLLGDIRCSVVVVAKDYWNRITEIVGMLPALKVLVVDDSDKEVAAAAAPGISVIGFDELTTGMADVDPGVTVDPGDPSAVVFTSGTTGRSKGILRTHEGDLAYSGSAIEAMQYTSADSLLLSFPLFHGFARYNGILPLAMVGGSVVLQNRFSVSTFWESARKEEATAFTFLGATIQMLLNAPESDLDRQHSVVKAHGAPVPARHLDDFKARFGVDLIETYGSSETGVITMNRPIHPGSCGAPIDAYDVELHDQEGHVVDQGQPGEVVVRARGVSAMFREYVGLPEETTRAFRGGWFHTGDIARADEDGWFYFVDRTKDVIRRRGENISSWEVEMAIASHDAVAEVAAYGVPSELTEEDVAVAVILRPGFTLDPEQVVAHASIALPRFALPRYVSFVEEFPKTPTGRIEKYKLREAGVAGARDLQGSR